MNPINYTRLVEKVSGFYKVLQVRAEVIEQMITLLPPGSVMSDVLKEDRKRLIGYLEEYYYQFEDWLSEIKYGK